MNQQAKLYKFTKNEEPQVHFVTEEEKLATLRPKYLEPRLWPAGVVDWIVAVAIVVLISFGAQAVFRLILTGNLW